MFDYIFGCGNIFAEAREKSKKIGSSGFYGVFKKRAVDGFALLAKFALSESRGRSCRGVIEIRLNEPALGVKYIPAGKVRSENPYLFDFDRFGFQLLLKRIWPFVSALIENDSDYNGEDDKIAQGVQEPVLGWWSA